MGTMKAVTAFELEAVRRQEVLRSDARAAHRPAIVLTESVETATGRFAGRLAAVALATLALVVRTGSPR